MRLRPAGRSTAAVVLAVSLALTACTSSGKEAVATKDRYAADDFKAAVYKGEEVGAKALGFWRDKDFHSHDNFVPPAGVQTCPLAHRSDAQGAVNMVEPVGGDPLERYDIVPKLSDDKWTPNITQGALIFATPPIAEQGMGEIKASVAQCPASYTVNGGPPRILGDYANSVRPVTIFGWTGHTQQLAHTYFPGQDNVYYEDLAIVVVQRSNAIYYLEYSQKKIIGERADAAKKAEDIVKTVLQRLG
jgi:hypothetical protein